MAEVERLREEMGEEEEEEDEDEDTQEEEEVEEEEEIDPDGDEEDVGEGEDGDKAQELLCNGVGGEGINEQMNGLSLSNNSEDDADGDLDNEEADLTAFVQQSSKKMGKKMRNSHTMSSDDGVDHSKVVTVTGNVDKAEEEEETTENVKGGNKKKRRRANKGGGGGTAENKKKESSKEVQGAVGGVGEDDEEESKEGTTAVKCKCMVCNQDFPSKSKLFKHIKQTGHAAPLEAVQAAVANQRVEASGGGKGGKKRRGKGARDF